MNHNISYKEQSVSFSGTIAPTDTGYTAIMVLLIILIHGCSKSDIDLGEQITFEIDSVFTGATYPVQVQLPVHYTSEEYYETIYILDGNWYFDHVAKENARISAETQKQSAIVVGIGHGNPRTTDYMPTTTREGVGGAEDFTGFLNRELIPYVENNFSVYTTPDRRAILGHSAGGLYAAYLFTNHNHLFGKYLMLSPSIWYDDGIILQYEEESRSTNQIAHHLLFVTHAELEPTQLFMKMFSERLHTYYPDADVLHHMVRRKNHSSSAKPAISEGLRFYYNLKQE